MWDRSPDCWTLISVSVCLEEGISHALRAYWILCCLRKMQQRAGYFHHALSIQPDIDINEGTSSYSPPAIVCVCDSWYLSVATSLTVITMVGLPLTSTRTQPELNQWELTCNPIYILIPYHWFSPCNFISFQPKPWDLLNKMEHANTFQTYPHSMEGMVERVDEGSEGRGRE